MMANKGKVLEYPTGTPGKDGEKMVPLICSRKRQKDWKDKVTRKSRK